MFLTQANLWSIYIYGRFILDLASFLAYIYHLCFFFNQIVSILICWSTFLRLYFLEIWFLFTFDPQKIQISSHSSTWTFYSSWLLTDSLILPNESQDAITKQSMQLHIL